MIRIKGLILRNKIKSLLLFIVIVVVLFQVFGKKDVEEVQTDDILPLVTVSTANNLVGGQNISTIGTVRAFTEAAITAEASGRVTSVNATLGQEVTAGFILATLENASQRASVLQAEGVYEAALAASAQSGVGVDEANTALVNAKNSSLSTVLSTYNTVNGVVRNNIDAFFADPDGRIPGLKLHGQGFTPQLNAERIAYQTLLSDWQTRANQLNVSSDLDTALADSGLFVDRTIAFLDIFISLFNDQDNSNAYTDAELQSFSTNFTSLRSTLLGQKNSIAGSVAGLNAARDLVRRADISASGTQGSAADAQVKQALGSLRAAQANLAKTILRTPISGTVNSIDVRTGDFVGIQDVTARVANNDALEIVTYVGDSEVSAYVVGEEVLVDGKFTGIITAVAPAVDFATKKTEVRIATENSEIQNGDTVTINNEVTGSISQTTNVPLSAVKFEIENGFMFTVVDGKLASKPVTTGIVRGGSVEITEGLNADEEFVLDARGLLAGTEVEVKVTE